MHRTTSRAQSGLIPRALLIRRPMSRSTISGLARRQILSSRSRLWRATPRIRSWRLLPGWRRALSMRRTIMTHVRSSTISSLAATHSVYDLLCRLCRIEDRSTQLHGARECSARGVERYDTTLRHRRAQAYSMGFAFMELLFFYWIRQLQRSPHAIPEALLAIAFYDRLVYVVEVHG